MANEKTRYEEWLEGVETPAPGAITPAQIANFLRSKGFERKEEPAVVVSPFRRGMVEFLGGEIPRPRPVRLTWQAEDGFALAIYEGEADKDVSVEWRKNLATDGMSVAIVAHAYQGWYAVGKDSTRAQELWAELLSDLYPSPLPVPTPERVVYVRIPGGLRPYGYPDNGEGGYENPPRFVSEALAVLDAAQEAIEHQRKEWGAITEQ
jgi:hypothetical protein